MKLGKYGDTRKKAKDIADIGETGRLIVLGVERNKNKNEEEVKAYIESCEQAKEYLIYIIEAYEFKTGTISVEEIKRLPLTNLEECQKFGEEMRHIHAEIKSNEKIPSIFYPFFPTSISRLSFTTFELILFFAIGILLYFIL